MNITPGGAHRSPKNDRPGVRAAITGWWDRIMRMDTTTQLKGMLGIVLAIAGLITLIVLAAQNSDRTGTAVAPNQPPAAETPVAAPTSIPPASAEATVAPSFGNEQGAAQPGPTPGSEPVAEAQAQSAFGVNAQRLLDEMRTHKPDITDEEVNKLVLIGDANIARNVPDLAADDPMIVQQVRAQFPNATPEQVATMARCVAEFTERQLAMRNGTTPPDSSNDHGGN
jgi:hypothetical protein